VRYDDPKFRKFLRSYQYACLRRGKRAATRRFDAAQEVVWRSRTIRQLKGDNL